MKLTILYEDNHLIAVFKPAGILTQEDKSGDKNLMDWVKSYLKEKYKKPGNVFLGLVHRLDRPVSGIILFAKTSKGASRLSEQFRNNKIEKTYHALVVGKPKNNRGVLKNLISKDKKQIKAILDKNDNARAAELYYETLKSSGKYSLLKIQTKTGRFHQIRAQLSALGCPIVGDKKYGAPFALPNKSIVLSATSLAFFTATTKEKIKISIPVPAEWKDYIDIKND